MDAIQVIPESRGVPLEIGKSNSWYAMGLVSSEELNAAVILIIRHPSQCTSWFRFHSHIPDLHFIATIIQSE
jgi:hypothetical protein